eukprot:TRINITY_DN4776_c0_g6_i1.p1 TRINITY_DN4776_c0_g6~~TRINITY_DN4776_c0_g6_i1.p1  ORF type:complete len:207 (+),score=70.89 TRINITY_DN4776_c0_g6_i1:23-643(+)
MQFVSEKQLAEERKELGISQPRVRDGSSKPLFQQLEENKAKEEEQYNEKHHAFRPPKSLDEDEVRFLSMIDEQQREKKRKQDEEEKQYLEQFEREIESRVVRVVDAPSLPQATLFTDPNILTTPAKKAQILPNVVIKKASSSKGKDKEKDPSKKKHKSKSKDQTEIHNTDKQDANKNHADKEKTRESAQPENPLSSLAAYGSDESD